MKQEHFVYCPGCGTEHPWPLEDVPHEVEARETACNHLASCGVMPAATVMASMSGLGDPRHSGDKLTWSVIDPRTTCIRQVLIERFWPHAVINPRQRWDATNGIIWHEALAGYGYWQGETEYILPQPDIPWSLSVEPKALRKLRPPWSENPGDFPGWKEYEIFPGIWYSTKADWVNFDGPGDLIDYKTTRSPGPGKDWGLKDEWKLQLVLTLKMLRELYGFIPRGQVGIWRVYTGHQDPNTTWRWFPLPGLVDNAAVLEAEAERLIRPHAELLVAKCREAMSCGDEGSLAALIRTVPLQGQAMFASRDGKRNKCTNYCSCHDTCYYSIQGIHGGF